MIVVSVDDDPRAHDYARQALQTQQYVVQTFDNAVDAISYVRDYGADVVLIDVRLPQGPDGLMLAKQIRAMCRECVIVMISAFADRDLVIEAMRAGVDDFIIKGKTDPQEFVKLIGEAIMRRRSLFPSLQSSYKQSGALELDLVGRTATVRGVFLGLTGMEFDVLAQLISKPGQVFGHAELHFLCTGSHVNPKTARIKMKAHIRNLRRKLEQAGQVSPTIQNVYGRGYKWDSSIADSNYRDRDNLDPERGGVSV